ncbi:MAG: sugar phosphate isomerase/epimerase family protein [Candidatus Poribacteria bacterium]
MKYKFKPGVSLRFSETPETDENLLALSNSKLDYVEITYASYCDNIAWTDTVRKILEKTSIKINSVHAPFSKEVDISRLDDGCNFAIQEISKSIDMAERISADILVVHGSSEPINDNDRIKRIAKCKSSLSILCEKVKLAGIKLAVEMLPRTCLGNTADELQILLDGLPIEHIGFCLDVNHSKDHTKIPDIVKQLGNRIITLHISDYDGVDEKHWMPFKGLIDWGTFANSLCDIEYSGAFIYEANLEGNTISEKLDNILSNFNDILSIAQKGECE